MLLSVSCSLDICNVIIIASVRSRVRLILVLLQGLSYPKMTDHNYPLVPGANSLTAADSSEIDVVNLITLLPIQQSRLYLQK